MAKIPEQCIERLQKAGLFVADPMPSSHVFPDGVLVGKPSNVQGNSIPGYQTGYRMEDDHVEFDAPYVWLYSIKDVWYVLAEEYSPGPGPGDFLDDWATADEAITDILDFFFGDSKRMQAKAEARAHKC